MMKFRKLAALVVLVCCASAVTAGHADAVRKRKAAVLHQVDYAYAGSGSTDQQHLTASWNDGRTGAPWVMVVHGGAWVSGDREDRLDVVRSFYGKGYQVFNVEYRHGTDSGTTYRDQLDDLAAARAWIVARASTFGINADRAALYGSSAGGNLGMNLAVEHPTWFRAMVSLAGVLMPERVATNVLYGTPEAPTSGNPGLYDNEVEITGCAYQTSPATDPCTLRWRDFRPALKFAADGNADTAFYLVQGDADKTNPWRSAPAVNNGLQNRNYDSALVIVPGGGHTNAILLDGGTREAAMHAWVAARV